MKVLQHLIYWEVHLFCKVGTNRTETSTLLNGNFRVKNNLFGRLLRLYVKYDKFGTLHSER